jgi:hypothetical protein
MRIYRAAWLACCCLLGVAGVLVVFVGSPTMTLALLICAGSIGGVVAWIALDPENDSRSPQDERRIIATSAVLSGAAIVAVVGLGVLLGGLMAVLLLVIVACGSPYAISRCLRRDRKHTHPPEPTPAPNVLSPAVLSDEALCLAWRASFSALQRAESAAQRLTIVEQRRSYLDELEHRSAAGLAAWLASGPRAAGDPSRYVLGDGAPGRSHIDWNDLLHDTDQ